MNSPTPNHPETSAFRVGLTGDFYKDGEPVYPDFDLEPLQREPGIALANFDEHRDEIAPEQLAGLNGVVVLSPSVTRHSLSQSGELLAISQPPFSPMNSTQFRSSRPFRQKQIPSSPFAPMNSTQFRSSRPFRQKQIPSSILS
jgi:hypothetical protein